MKKAFVFWHSRARRLWEMNVNKASKSGTLRKNERQATTLEKERTDDVGVEEEEEGKLV
jgi:hypothetical protein